MDDTQNIQQEIWEPVVGWEGLYEVSNLGRVKRIGGKILKPIEKAGYLYICLCKDGVAKRFAIHRIIAEVFIPNPENKRCIDHKNGERGDNRVENLRWVTHKENNNNPVTRQKYLDVHCREIEKIDKEGNTKTYHSITEAEADGFNRSSIHRSCTGKRPVYKGFIWRYRGSHINDDVDITKVLNSRKHYKKRKDSHTVERRKGNDVKVYEKLTDVIADGFDYRSVSHCCLYPNKRKQHKGYQWRYLD